MYNNVKDYERIEKLIEETKDIYKDNAFHLDRLDSECQHAFVIRSNLFKGATVFYSVEEFEKWIKG